jgi:hypothetical protein
MLRPLLFIADRAVSAFTPSLTAAHRESPHITNGTSFFKWDIVSAVNLYTVHDLHDLHPLMASTLIPALGAA